MKIDVHRYENYNTVVREQSPGAAGARIVILSKHVNMITADVDVGMFVVMRGVRSAPAPGLSSVWGSPLSMGVSSLHFSGQQSLQENTQPAARYRIISFIGSRV